MNTKLDTIHHMAIQVNNIAEAASWYTGNFNCEIAYQDQTWAMLKFANTAIALVLAEQHPSHVAILRDDLSPYGKAVSHRDGTQSVYIKDTNGNHLEMLKLPKDKTHK